MTESPIVTLNKRLYGARVNRLRFRGRGKCIQEGMVYKLRHVRRCLTDREYFEKTPGYRQAQKSLARRGGIS